MIKAADAFISAVQLLESHSLFLLVALVLVFVIRHYFLKPKNFPPGPFGLPIVGYLPFFGKEAHVTLHKLRLKYGGIYSLLLGSRPVVVIANYDVMKEAYLKSALLGRPYFTAFDAFLKIKGIGVSSGDNWVEDRKFFIKNLRRFGDKLDEDLETEIMYLLKNISKTKGKPFSFKNLVSSSVLNLAMNFATNVRYDFDDPIKILLDKTVNRSLKYLGMVNYRLYLPWLQPFFLAMLYFGTFWRETIKVSIEMIKVFERNADAFNEGNIKNFSDAFIDEMEKQRNSPGTTYTIKGYLGTMLALVGAGFDTVAMSLSWVMLVLAAHPDVQKKVHDEIDLVFGNDGKPNWEDRIRLPYTQAVIMEIQRWRTILPLSGLRRTLSDIKIQGYHIPKDTTVLFNLWGLHNDTQYWENPENFQPERFLSEDGSNLVKPKSFVPFSFGKRSCPAEGIAYKEIFVYMTSILQKYTVVWPENHLPNLEGVTHGGLTLVPHPHRLSFVPRLEPS